MIEMTQMNNIDGLLAGVETSAPVVSQENVSQAEITPETASDTGFNENVSRETIQNSHENEPKSFENDDVSRETTEQNQGSPIDEYGNPVEKPKMYSQEEVNRIIRERLARGRQAQEQVQEPAPTPQEAPAEQEEDWQAQLNRVIDHRIESRQREHQEREWRSREAQKQAEFEDKFSIGMSKYADFHQVVANKPITDTMMMATRHLENPAAFIYGAAKLHPQEIDRISKIQDPYIQASEVGRLHERMVKERRSVSSAGKPLEAPKSDMPHQRGMNSLSLEDRIAQHAKSKLRNQ
jgi:hypothetical protein